MDDGCREEREKREGGREGSKAAERHFSIFLPCLSRCVCVSGWAKGLCSHSPAKGSLSVFLCLYF